MSARRNTPFVALALLAAACTPSETPDIVRVAPDAGTSASDGGGSDGGTPDAGPGACAGSYGGSVDVPVDEADLLEISGVVASRRHPHLLWLHNDSGDTARLFAMRDDGFALGQLTLPGVNAIDFEDLAAAACPDGSGRPCLWIADSGNNALNRTDLALYVLPEPEIDTSRAFGTREAEEVWRYEFTYPEGQGINSEGLVVEPDGSAASLFEKSENREVQVFRYAAPFVAGPHVLEGLGSFVSPGLAIPHGTNITGADLHPARSRLLLRVYTGAFEYRFASTDWATELVAGRGQVVPFVPKREPQGEAIAYDAAGTGVWTGSEDPNQNSPVPLHHHACQ